MKEHDEMTVKEVEDKGRPVAVRIRCVSLNREFPSKSKLALFCAKYVTVRDCSEFDACEFVRLVKYFETALAPCCWDRSKRKLVKGLLFEVCDD